MVSMTTMIRAAAVIVVCVVATACRADRREIPDAGDCVPAAMIKGSSADARLITHLVGGPTSQIPGDLTGTFAIQR